MSLFGKIFQGVTEEVKLNEQESFAGIALAMAGADGNVGHGEWDEIVNYMNRLRPLTELSQKLKIRMKLPQKTLKCGSSQKENF